VTKLVLADGTFDPLHAGHVRYLLRARRYGSRLLVRAAPDDAILAKGRTPFQTHAERVLVLQHLRCVDQVCTESTLEDAVRRHKPTYLVKGRDWQARLPIEVILVCHELGTTIQFTNTRMRSSTERLAKMA